MPKQEIKKKMEDGSLWSGNLSLDRNDFLKHATFQSKSLNIKSKKDLHQAVNSFTNSPVLRNLSANVLWMDGLRTSSKTRPRNADILFTWHDEGRQKCIFLKIGVGLVVKTFEIQIQDDKIIQVIKNCS